MATQMQPYDIAPPPEAVRTEAVEKPQPETDPVDIWEVDVLDTSVTGGGKDRVVLFSGGDDSLVLTHMAMENDWADLVLHLDTNSSVPENIDFVRRCAEEYQWPLMIISSPMDLLTFGYRYGFPGSSCHNMAYNSFKARQLHYFYQRRQGDVKFFSGVRQLESDRRMENVEGEISYESVAENGDFTGWWLSPLFDKSDGWMEQYRREHDLLRNPVSQRLHRSGDCQCLAYGHRDTELTDLQAQYPEFARWLLNVESRVQEYRGRVDIFEERYPEVFDTVDARRKEERPNPMRLTLLKDHAPDVYDEIVGIDAEQARMRGKLDETNYLGHGGMSSKELREKFAEASPSQETLCESCSVPAETVASSVRRQQQQAIQQLDETVQISLDAASKSAGY